MRIRSAVLRQAGLARPYDVSQPLRWEALDLAEPGPGEVLVRVRAAGLCHSDLSTINGSRLRPTPMAIGHEAAGEVVALGPDVADRRVGQHVVLTFVPACGSCEPCAEGRPALCVPGAAANGRGELLAGGRRLRTVGHRVGPAGGDVAGGPSDSDDAARGGTGNGGATPGATSDGGSDGVPRPSEDVHHHLGVSAFSDHVVVSARSTVPIDPDLPWEVAALFGCAVLTGVGAVVNAARVTPGESVAIFGLGGVGLAALLGAVAAGAQPIVAIDRVPEKLALARELGATTVIPADDGVDVAATVRDATGGGAHHAIETVGSAAVLAQAYAATRRAGQTTTVGLPDPADRLRIPAVTITAEERTIRGSYLGSCVPQRDIPRFVALHRAGRLPVDRLLSHRLTPEEVNGGFERLAAGEGVRQVIVFP